MTTLDETVLTMAIASEPHTTTQAITVDEAKDAVQAFYDAEQNLSAQYLAKQAELAQAERKSGANALDALLTGADMIDETTTLRNQCATIEKAIGEARTRRQHAIRDLFAAQASDLRTQATDLKTEATRVDALIRPLLEKLRSIAGVEYVPKQPASDMLFGSVETPQAGPMFIHTVLPRQTLLTDQANALLRTATALEQRKPVDSGEVTSGSVRWVSDDPRPRIEGITTAGLSGHYEQVATGNLDGLISEVQKLGPLVIAPTSIAIRQWYDGIAGAVEAADRPLPRRVYTLRLVWRNATIDANASGIKFNGAG